MSTRRCCSTSTCRVEQQWKPLLIISGIHDMPGEPEAEAVQHF